MVSPDFAVILLLHIQECPRERVNVSFPVVTLSQFSPIRLLLWLAVRIDLYTIHVDDFNVRDADLEQFCSVTFPPLTLPP